MSISTIQVPDLGSIHLALPLSTKKCLLFDEFLDKRKKKSGPLLPGHTDRVVEKTRVTGGGGAQLLYGKTTYSS